MFTEPLKSAHWLQTRKVLATSIVTLFVSLSVSAYAPQEKPPEKEDKLVQQEDPAQKQEKPVQKQNHQTQSGVIKNVVLVHGAYADASGWRGVFDHLTRQGYNVWAAQSPETTLQADVDNVNRLVNLQDGPVILAGHSYGGVVITQAGNNPKVKGLVYVAAIAPAANENIGELRSMFPPPADDVMKIGDGFQILNPKTFHADFAADISPEDAEFMAYSQVPINVPAALGAPVTKAAWEIKPSWYVVATDDRKINPELERFMAKRAGSTTYEIAGSHAILISKPKEIADVIIEASKIRSTDDLTSSRP